MHSCGLVRWPHPLMERVPLFNYVNWLNLLILQERSCHLNLLSLITNTIITGPLFPLLSTASHLIAQLSQCYFTWSKGVLRRVHFLLIVENPSLVIYLLSSFRGLWNLAVLTPHDIKVTVFVLVLPLMLQTGDCQILKFALWGDGNPMHLLNISGFLRCLIELICINFFFWHSHIHAGVIGWFTGVTSPSPWYVSA